MENKPKRTRSSLAFFCKANGVIPVITLTLHDSIKHSSRVNDYLKDQTTAVYFNYKYNEENRVALPIFLYM